MAAVATTAEQSATTGHAAVAGLTTLTALAAGAGSAAVIDPCGAALVTATAISAVPAQAVGGAGDGVAPIAGLAAGAALTAGGAVSASGADSTGAA